MSVTIKVLNFIFFLPLPSIQEAKAAIEDMNGKFLAGRNIRTNWATRKPAPKGPEGGGATGGFSNQGICHACFVLHFSLSLSIFGYWGLGNTMKGSTLLLRL